MLSREGVPGRIIVSERDDRRVRERQDLRLIEERQADHRYDAENHRTRLVSDLVDEASPRTAANPASEYRNREAGAKNSQDAYGYADGVEGPGPIPAQQAYRPNAVKRGVNAPSNGRKLAK